MVQVAMTSIVPVVFAATLAKTLVLGQFEFYPVREQARGYLGS